MGSPDQKPVRASAAGNTGDPRLRPWLEATSPVEAEAALDALLGGDVAGIARVVVRREFTGSSAAAAYVDDVVADVRLRLVRKLRALKADGGPPIDDFAAYAAVVAENACYAFLRAQYPERTRFRNRVRYVMARHPALALARDDSGAWRCQTRGVRPSPVAGSAMAFLDDPRGWMARVGIDPGAELPALLAAVVTRFDRPVELDRLVDGLALALGIADAAPARRDEDTPAAEPQDPAPDVATRMEQRESLARTWREIVDLPPRQRAALLLNLRDPEGGAVVHLLPGTGVADLAAIAAAVDVTPQVLASLWDTLPLDDLAVAERLGITRQQVINLRKSARARLARRLALPPAGDR